MTDGSDVLRWSGAGQAEAGLAGIRPAVRRLVGTPDNPVPTGAQVRVLHAEDGIGLRVARFEPKAASRGTLFLLQGRGDTIEKYFEAIGDFQARGFCVVSFDWRGQGGSQRLLPDARRSHVDRFAAYRRDLRAVLAAHRERGPVMAVAHSMGAAVLLGALRENPHLVDAAAVSAPMIALSPALKPPGAEILCGVLAHAGLRRACVPGRMREAAVAGAFAPGNILTSDPARFVRWHAAMAAVPEFGLGKPTIGWLQAAFRTMGKLQDPRTPAAIATPLLVAAGDADRVTSTPAAERFARRLPRGEWLELPQARHEILMERDAVRDRYLAAFDRLADRLPAAGSGALRAAV